MSNLGSLAESGVIALAVSEAAGAVVEPALEPARQEAEKSVHARILEMRELAQLVATALQTVDEVKDDVLRNGYHDDQFQAAVQLALTAPGVPDAEKLFLRQTADPAGSITKAQLDHAYAKAGLEYQYWAPLTAAAQTTLFTPAQLSLAAVRSTLDDQGLLVRHPDTSDSNVPQYVPPNINIIDEAAAAGISAERLRVLIGSIGLPLAPIAAAQAYFRNILTLGGYNQAVLQSDTRPEWAPFILDYAREILTAHDGVELRLRGWLPDDASMYALTARHGMSQADTDLLFKVLGRPMNHHQVFLAERRGGVYNVTPPDIDPAFHKSLQESNERPEWYGLEWAARYSQPSVFVVRQFLKDGGDPAWAQTKLFYEGWEQSDIDIFIAEYTKQAAATANPVLKSQHTAAITAARKAYLAGNLANTVASEQLQALGQTADDAARILAVWDIMYEIENSLPPGSGGPH